MTFFDISCHECGYKIVLAAKNRIQAEIFLKDLHWYYLGDNKVLCPKCAKDIDDPNSFERGRHGSDSLVASDRLSWKD